MSNCQVSYCTIVDAVEPSMKQPTEQKSDLPLNLSMLSKLGALCLIQATSLCRVHPYYVGWYNKKSYIQQLYEIRSQKRQVAYQKCQQFFSNSKSYNFPSNILHIYDNFTNFRLRKMIVCPEIRKTTNSRSIVVQNV